MNFGEIKMDNRAIPNNFVAGMYRVCETGHHYCCDENHKMFSFALDDMAEVSNRFSRKFHHSNAE